jgi:hypothetical protein
MSMISVSIKRAAILVCALSGIAQAVWAHECTLSDAAGKYGYTSSGTIVSPAIGPFTAVGIVTFTESGLLSGAQTTSVAGNLFDETLNGTYIVNPDCTGTATVYVYHGSTLARTSRINLVWDRRQNEARAIFLTPGTNITIQARKVTDD